MTKEQEEAIERINRFKTIKVLYGNTFAIHTEQLKTLQKDIETVLSMLKEKDKEIEYQIEKRNNQKEELAILNEKQKEMNKSINTIKSCKGQIKRLEHTNKSYKGIINKQNKQIDLMAEYIATLDIEEDICANVENDNCDKMNFGECEDCIKKFFERKSEE